MRRPREDRLLLLAAAALLGLGGGVGCDPVLEGVTLRAARMPASAGSPPDWFVAFSGKKPPGEGFAELPYALTPPFGVEARMGVFTAEALAASAGADGCIGLREAASSDAHTLCVRWESEPAALRVSFGAESAACEDATRAELRLGDDGVTVTARYRCSAGAPFSTLGTAPSLFGSGETWHAFVSAEGLVKGGQVAFEDFAVASAPFASPHPDADVLQATFDALRLGLAAFYAVEAGELGEAASLAGEAHGNVHFAEQHLSAALADATGAGKLLAKAKSSHAKLLASASKLLKGLAKTAAADADALEALAAGL